MPNTTRPAPVRFAALAATAAAFILAPAPVAGLAAQPPRPSTTPTVDPSTLPPPSILPNKPTTPTNAPQRWKGAVPIGPEVKADFFLTLRPGNPPTGTITIPLQNATDLPLAEVVITDAAITFVLPIPNTPEANWARFSFALEKDGQSAIGSVRQGPGNAPVTMTKLKDGEQFAGRKRPQTPKPPFAYPSRDVTYTTPDGSTIAGTLSIPLPPRKPKAGETFRFPALLLLTGSGPQDRDETIFDHKPFAVIADHLARRGFAVLRVDDRGVGGSTSTKPGRETLDDFASDALAGIAFLKAQPEIDPTQIGILGHSEGGIVAPMAAAQSKDVAFLVLLAGTGLPGRSVLREQVAIFARLSGADEARVNALTDAQGRFFDLLTAQPPAPDADLRAALRAMVILQVGLDPSKPLSPEENQQLEALLDRELPANTSPWMRRFAAFDPKEALSRVKVPVLALNGERDLQVNPATHLPEIEKALKAAGNTRVTAKLLPGLNHLFQPAQTGSPSEYDKIEVTLDPGTLETISDWLKATLGVK